MSERQPSELLERVSRAISVSICGRERGWRAFQPEGRAAIQVLRSLLGDPFATGHSGCEDGPFVKLKYVTVAEAMQAHDALIELLRDPA